MPKAKRTKKSTKSTKNQAKRKQPDPKGPLEVEHQEPAVEHQEPVVQTRGKRPDRKRREHKRIADLTAFLPKKEKLPQEYYKQQLACPKCRCFRLADGGQAIGCVASGKHTAYFYCKKCGHRFALPVRTK